MQVVIHYLQTRKRLTRYWLNQISIFEIYYADEKIRAETECKKILRVIDCCVILHNFLFQLGDDEILKDRIGESEDESDDDLSDFGHDVGEQYFLSVDEDNEDDKRRQVCMYHFKDMDMI